MYLKKQEKLFLLLVRTTDRQTVVIQTWGYVIHVLKNGWKEPITSKEKNSWHLLPTTKFKLACENFRLGKLASAIMS